MTGDIGALAANVLKGGYDPTTVVLARSYLALAAEKVELEDCIAGLLIEPGAGVKPYIVERAIKQFRARHASRQPNAKEE